jgi:hypothetical protein
MSAHAVPVQHPIPSSFLLVQRLARADHGNMAGRNTAERLEHCLTDVAHLNALDPRGMLGDECGMKGFERAKLLALVNIRIEHGDQIEVTPARAEAPGCERSEEIQTSELGPEVAPQQRCDFGQGLSGIFERTIVHGLRIYWPSGIGSNSAAANNG